jgi:hypothetical protein
VPPAGFHIHHDRAELLQCQQVFGHARFTGAHCRHDVSTACRPVRRKIAENLVSRPVAKGRNGGFDVGGPRFVVGPGNPRHATILTERFQKSKTRSLDDTLSIFDNSLCSLCVVVVDARGHSHSWCRAAWRRTYRNCLVEAVKTMRVETRANDAQKEDHANAVTVDVSLRGAPEPTALAVPVDQVMVAVDSVQRYVVSHLSRVGRACDVDDVMQDIRVAVWDGVTRGHYRQLPGVSFGAWVQGVCANICSAHIRRELSHPTFPLLIDPGTEAPGSIDAVAVLGTDQSADRVIEQDWARTIIELTRDSVPHGTWELALGSVTGQRRYGPPSPQDRRRWHAVTVVRQTARTVQNALEVEHGVIRNIADVCQHAAECLPTPVLRRTAAMIVRPGVRGPERSRALARLAAELGVTERYLAVQIGFARRLYQTSWRILQAGMASAR